MRSNSIIFISESQNCNLIAKVELNPVGIMISVAAL